jgi:hypothetical protein
MSPTRYALALWALASIAAGAEAAEVSCDALVASVLETGETPRVSIDAARGTVRIEAAVGHCVEGIERWAARTWPAPERTPTSPAARPAAPAGPVRKPPQPLLEPESTAQEPLAAEEPAPAPAQTPPPRPEAPCDQALADLYGAGWHTLGGLRHWLAGVHTIDMDGDGWTDNLGFRFRRDEGADRVMRYFPAPGRPAAKTVAALRLADDALVPRICFGRIAFARPPERIEESIRIPEGARRPAGAVSWTEPGLGPGVWLAVVGVLAMMGMGAVGVVRRRRRRPPVAEETGASGEDRDFVPGDADQDEADG